jgi:hypothetical protein
MKKIELYALVGLAMSATLLVMGQVVRVHFGFHPASGDYLKWTEAQQRDYVQGVIDGMYLAPLFGAPGTNVEWLADYLGTKSDEQVAAVVGKYIKENPEQWDAQLNVQAFNALHTAHRKMLPREKRSSESK